MAEIISIDASAVQKLEAGLKKSPQRVTSLLSQTIDASMAVLAKHTLKDNPVPYQHGFLLASFRFQKLSAFSARWYPTVKYAGYVDQGTAWIKPRHYMQAIAEKADQDIQKLFNSTADKISNEILK